MQGFLLVDKSAGWTSFDVVNYVRRVVATAEAKKPKNCKVGHTGTLDPFATGLLVLLIGKDYTRQAGSYSKLDKTYEITMRLGQISTTGDPEGELTALSSHQPSLDELQAALPDFRGQISQVPPAYSAIKVDGQRAYKLARAGQAVQLEPRPVTVHRLELMTYNYPDVTLVADVSSGTYIRTLVSDIGQVLGTGAYTAQLRRSRVGQFELSRALTPSELTALTPDRLAAALAAQASEPSPVEAYKNNTKD